MKITYIHHSCFLVELERVMLLFDYMRGSLPPLDDDKDLLVFASHRHEDHFSPAVFKLAEKHPRIRYILSDIYFNIFKDVYYLSFIVSQTFGCTKYRTSFPASNASRIKVELISNTGE